jgi:hypothetical protein
MEGWVNASKPVGKHLRLVHVVWDSVHWWVDVFHQGDRLQFVVRRWDRESPVRIGIGHVSWFPLLSHPDVKEKAMAWLKRVVASEASKQEELQGPALAWATTHPALHEYLTMEKYPDGGQRQTATLLLFVEGVEWKGCLRDRDTSRTLWVTAGSLLDVIETLEVMLQSDDAQWRKDKPQQQWQGKKKK